MKTAEEILDRNGFDLNEFVIDNEYSAHNLLISMQEYAKLYHAAKVAAVTDAVIQKHIEINTRDDEGFSMMDEETFYQGAKWFKSQLLKGGEK